jgi:hypothetical protein
LPSIEELIIISILKNKRINPKNNDMLSYELSEALQTNWYWSNVEYSDSTAWVVYMNYSHTGSVNKNHYG